MGDRVYLDYDAATLFAEYNNRGKVSDYEDYASDWDKRSEAARANLSNPSIGLTYGDGPRETFDLFLPENDNPPLFAFIHGGYWQWNNKDSYAFLAEPFVEAGIAFANVEYALCPDVDLTQLVGQVRRAFAHLWRNGKGLGFDPDRIVVGGHSAGGHLTGVVLTTDWAAYGGDLPAKLVSAGMPISGVFDLEPIRHTAIGDPLGLDAASATMLSPMFNQPLASADTVVTLGAHEGREFHRQAEEFAAHCRRQGVEISITSVPGCNHFSVIETLATSEGVLFKTAQNLVKR
jgi:arylformamidase